MNEADLSHKNPDESNSKDSSFFCKLHVKESKDEGLKRRLQTLIHAKGLSEAEFYNKLGMTRQHWYSISWGIWECPVDLRVKIAKALDTDSCVIFEAAELKEDLENEG